MTRKKCIIYPFNSIIYKNKGLQNMGYVMNCIKIYRITLTACILEDYKCLLHCIIDV